jgi:hypothetical protein
VGSAVGTLEQLVVGVGCGNRDHLGIRGGIERARFRAAISGSCDQNNSCWRACVVLRSIDGSRGPVKLMLMMGAPRASAPVDALDDAEGGGRGDPGTERAGRENTSLWRAVPPPKSGRVSRPHRPRSPAWPYSFAATNPTTFDSDCICRTILPTSSFGSLVSERRMR